MKKKKKPYLIRLVIYYFKCLWYYVLFPITDGTDDFTKQIRGEK